MPVRQRARTLFIALFAAAIASLGLAAGADATPITPPTGGESFDIHPGDSFQVGYDFTIPGNSSPVTVQFTALKATVNFSCPGGSTGSFVIPMPDYTVTVSDGNWYPSGDQQDPSVWQGSITAPDGCGNGQTMHQNGIAVFTGNVFSSPAGVQLHYRFHDRDGNASGSWSSTDSVTTTGIMQTIQGEIYKCVNGAPTTTLVSGRTVAVPSLNLSSANPLQPTQVPAGTYTMTADAPAGKQFVACGQSGVTISSPTHASQSVTVPSGGAGDGKFYVAGVPTGYVEICKSSANGVTGTFAFTVAGQTVNVPAGACSSALSVPAGTQVIHEVFRDGFTMVGATASPSNRLQNVDLTQRNVTVTVVPGDVSTQTLVTVTNKPTGGSGSIKICEIAGSGTAEGTDFSFSNSADGQVVQVPAGPKPGGYCVPLDGTFPV